MNLLFFLIISVLSGYGMAVAIVEKGKEWPIKPWKIRIKIILKKIHWKLPRMLSCATCTSFWTTLVIDCCLCVISFILFGSFYFLWPISGFITVGFSWTITELINVLDKDNITNIYIGDKENEN